MFLLKGTLCVFWRCLFNPMLCENEWHSSKNGSEIFINRLHKFDFKDVLDREKRRQWENSLYKIGEISLA